MDDLDVALAFGSFAFVEPSGVLAVADAEQRRDDTLESAGLAARPAEVALILPESRGHGCDAAEAGEAVCGAEGGHVTSGRGQELAPRMIPRPGMLVIASRSPDVRETGPRSPCSGRTLTMQKSPS